MVGYILALYGAEFRYEDGKELSDILKFNIEEGIRDVLREY